MTSKLPKIMILYASYGDGHYQASKAIESCFYNKGITDIILLDLLAKAHPLLNELTKFVYLRSFKTLPSVYGWVYNITKDMQPDTSLLKAINSIGMNKLQQLIKKAQPDLVIHTFPQLAMPNLLKKTGRSLPFVNVVTDFDLHGRWIHSGVDRYYVATEDMKQEITERGIPGERVLVSGIPLKSDFCTRKQGQKPEWLGKLNPRKKTVLLMAGAYGVMQGIRDICEQLLSHGQYEILAVCGRNKELYRVLKENFGSNADFHLFGYISEVAQMMQVSDCIITKPGGITLSESLACRLPMFIYRPVPGQELNNALYMESKGIAGIAYSPDSLIRQIGMLLDDPSRLDEVHRKIENLRKPDAAEVIVKDILEQWFLPDSSSNLVLAADSSSYIKY